MVFYPGTMGSPHMYPILLEELYRLGCNVVALHPLSHGQSPRRKKAFTMHDILANGKSAEAFARLAFSGPIVISGHSQGGIACLAHAMQNTQVKAIFPINTLLPHKEDAGSVTRFRPFLRHKNILLRMLRFGAKLFPALPIPLLAYLSLSRILHGAYKVRMDQKHNRFTYPLAFLSSLFHLDLRQVEKEGSITCPVYLYTAKNDALFTLSMMQESLQSISAPQKKLIVLPGGGHMCAMSALYAKHIAAHMAATCAGLGLPLHATQRQDKGKNKCNIKA